jgi:hypothetical protein
VESFGMFVGEEFVRESVDTVVRDGREMFAIDFVLIFKRDRDGIIISENEIVIVREKRWRIRRFKRRRSLRKRETSVNI